MATSMLRTPLLCSALSALALACAPGTEGTPDAGDTTPDAGDTTDAGNTPDAGPTTPAPFELTGEWHDDFGNDSVIDSTRWDTFTVVEYDHAAHVTYTRNASDAPFGPNTYNKVVYTPPANDGTFFYCFADFGKDTLADAKASTAIADATDPATGGCGGFPWTQDKPAPASITGAWSDNFGGTLSIGRRFGDDDIRAISNTQRWLVTRTADTAQYNPGKFNRIVWTAPAEDGSFYACWVDFALDTALDALASGKTADDTALDTTGCGGFPWTKYTPILP